MNRGKRIANAERKEEEKGMLEELITLDKITDEDLVLAFREYPVDVLKALAKRTKRIVCCMEKSVADREEKK